MAASSHYFQVPKSQILISTDSVQKLQKTCRCVAWWFLIQLSPSYDIIFRGNSCTSKLPVLVLQSCLLGSDLALKAVLFLLCLQKTTETTIVILELNNASDLHSFCLNILWNQSAVLKLKISFLDILIVQTNF